MVDGKLQYRENADRNNNANTQKKYRISKIVLPAILNQHKTATHALVPKQHYLIKQVSHLHNAAQASGDSRYLYVLALSCSIGCMRH